MVELARSPAPMEDIDLYVYNWLTADNASRLRDKLQKPKGRVCRMIGELFKELSYDNAMRLYS